MLSAISPLAFGAAATALSSVAEAIPTPGEFASAFRLAGDAQGQAAGIDGSATDDRNGAVAHVSRTELRRMIRDVEKSLGKLPGLHDIDTTKAIRLKLDASGNVRAADDHPDAAKINAMLAADENLSAAIGKVLRSINAATSPELLGDVSSGGASFGEPTLTFLDGRLTPSLA